MKRFVRSLHVDVTTREALTKITTHKQARNQLGTPGGAKSFPRGAQIF